MCRCGLHTVLKSNIGTLMRLLAAEPCKTFIPMSVSLWNDLGDPIFDGVGLTGFKSRANVFLLAKHFTSLLSNTVFTFSSFILRVRIVGLGSSD